MSATARPREHPKRGLSCTTPAHDGDQLAREDGERDVLKESAAPLEFSSHVVGVHSKTVWLDDTTAPEFRVCHGPFGHGMDERVRPSCHEVNIGPVAMSTT